MTVSVRNCIKAMIDAFPERIAKTAETPAADHSFTWNQNRKLPTADKVEHFHMVAAKRSILTERVGLHSQPAVPILCMRESKPQIKMIGKISETNQLPQWHPRVGPNFKSR